LQSFNAWKSVIRDELGLAVSKKAASVDSHASGIGKDVAFSVLVAGDESSLVSVKLARYYPFSIVVSMKSGPWGNGPSVVDDLRATLRTASPSPSNRPLSGPRELGPVPASQRAHADLVSLLAAKNNLLCSAKLTTKRMRALAAANDPFRFALFEGEQVVSDMVSDAVDILFDVLATTTHRNQTAEDAATIAGLIATVWEDRLATLLRLSGTTLLSVVPMHRVFASLTASIPRCLGIDPSVCDRLAYHGASATSGYWWDTTTLLDEDDRTDPVLGFNIGGTEQVPAVCVSAPKCAFSTAIRLKVPQDKKLDLDGDGFPDARSFSHPTGIRKGDLVPEYALEDLQMSSDAKKESSQENPAQEDALQGRANAIHTGISLPEPLINGNPAEFDTSIPADAPGTGTDFIDVPAPDIPFPGEEPEDQAYSGESVMFRPPDKAQRNGNALGQPGRTGNLFGRKLLSAGTKRSIRSMDAPSRQRISSNPIIRSVITALKSRYVARSSAIADDELAGLPQIVAQSYAIFGNLIGDAVKNARLIGVSGNFVVRRDPRSFSAPSVFLKVVAQRWSEPGGEVSPVHMPAISLHTLLLLQPMPDVRVRLFQMFMSLPLPAIARSSETAAWILSDQPSTSRAEARLAPWNIFLAQDKDRGCMARLSVRIAPYVVGDSAPAIRGKLFASPLCLLSSGRSVSHFLEPRGVPENGPDVSADDVDARTQEQWSALLDELRPLDTFTGGSPGAFSFAEYNSGLGLLSLSVARMFPNATVLSIENEPSLTDAHLAATLRGGMHNNLILRSPIDLNTVTRLYESPEFFRYQHVSMDLLTVLARHGRSGSQPPSSFMGSLLAIAATTFVSAPPSMLLSLGFTIFSEAYPMQDIALPGLASLSMADGSDDSSSASRAAALLHNQMHEWINKKRFGSFGGSFSRILESAVLDSSPFILSQHPRPFFEQADQRVLSAMLRDFNARSGDTVTLNLMPLAARRFNVTALGYAKQTMSPYPLHRQKTVDTHLSNLDHRESSTSRLWIEKKIMSSLPENSGAANDAVSKRAFGRLTSGLLRADIVDMTRHVNHHFQSDIDGHKRKYTLHVRANYSASAVLALHMQQHGISDPHQMTPTDLYALLEDGNHPNAGLSGPVVLSIGRLESEELLQSARVGRRKQEEEDALRVAATKAGGGPSSSGAKTMAGLDPDTNGLGIAFHTPWWGFYTKSPVLIRSLSEFAARSSVQAGEITFATKEGQMSETLPSSVEAVQIAKTLHELCCGSKLQRKSAADILTGDEYSEKSVSFPMLGPGVTSIILTRDHDGAVIPYASVWGVTLITALRLNLLAPQRLRAYHQFVALPVYLDMTPWNIVFQGPRLDYIDYDTRDRNYDALIRRAFEMMEVLFNYKRTVEDFEVRLDFAVLHVVLCHCVVFI
jgi:hypothetical protein